MSIPFAHVRDLHQIEMTSRCNLRCKPGKVFCMSDGTIVPCSLDGKGEDPLGTVFDDVSTMITRPYKLCVTCDQNLGIEGWNQQESRDERGVVV